MARDVGDGADMVLHVGDISYANGDGDVWDSFMAAIEPASKHVPYMVVVGAPLSLCLGVNCAAVAAAAGGSHAPPLRALAEGPTILHP